MPNTLRSCIVAEEGYTFLCLDAKQLEMIVLGVLSQDQQLLEDVKTGDVHQATATRMGNSRYDAKQGNFALVYGASEDKLAEMLECSIAEAQQFMAEHKRTYPVLYQWMEATIAQAKVDGYVTNMFGRIRPIPELNAGSFSLRQKGEREAINTIVQGTAVDIVKLIMLYLRKLYGEGIRLVLQVHDEILWEVPDDSLEWAIETSKELEQAFPDYPCTVKTGKVYGELKEVQCTK